MYCDYNGLVGSDEYLAAIIVLLLGIINGKILLRQAKAYIFPHRVMKLLTSWSREVK